MSHIEAIATKAAIAAMALSTCLTLCPRLLLARVQEVQEIRIPNTGIIGRVTDPNGAAIAGAVVKAKSETNSNAPAVGTKSDESGRYRISLSPGKYRITITAHPYKPVVTEVSMSVDELTLNVPMGTNSPVHAVVHQKFVKVSVNGVLGPMGYVETPSLSGATQLSGVNSQEILASQDYNFPSLIFYISAAPLVYTPPDSDDGVQIDKIESAQETNRNPVWLDATFTLHPKDAEGNDVKDACSGEDGKIQVLGLLPQQTAAATHTQPLADAASAVNDVAGALASFYPGVQTQVTSATKALNILFKDIFPPKPIAYQYSYMDGNCRFGWFFRPNTTGSTGAAGEASILGIQTGIILLKTDKSIKTIVVTAQTLSAWNDRPTSFTKRLFLGPATTLSFTLPDPKNIDFGSLTNPSQLPLLISKEEAMKILHLKKKDWDAFVKSARLVSTVNNEYVTRASVIAFLGLTNPPIESNASGAGGGVAPHMETVAAKSGSSKQIATK